MNKPAKQTAVEWLSKQISSSKYFYKLMEDINSRSTIAQSDIIEQAKEMEKKQIMEAVYDSMGTNFDPNIGRAELYYNEKYEKGKSNI